MIDIDKPEIFCRVARPDDAPRLNVFLRLHAPDSVADDGLPDDVALSAGTNLIAERAPSADPEAARELAGCLLARRSQPTVDELFIRGIVVPATLRGHGLEMHMLR